MNGAMHVATTFRPRLLRLGLAFLLAGTPAFLPAALGPVDGRVRLNSIGFTPDASKQATVAASAATFRVLRVSDDAVVLEGALGADIRTAVNDTDETVRIADFTALRTPGQYQLDVTDVGRSAPFTIAADVWREPLRLATRAFYLWRCGTAVSGTANGLTFQHAACHLNDGRLDYVGGGSVRQDGSGGWHDAGDYNKYVVNAGVSVGLLFKAWEHHRARIDRLDLALPENGNGVPDLLNELRWELDWLLKMQAADGRVYHKLSELNFTYWGVPQADPNLRYFVPWSTTATADFVAMLALAARHFAEFDPVYAARCLAAARTSWAALVANPTNVPANQTGFGTGGYSANDNVHRLWAAAEMWAATGEAEFLQSFEQRAANTNFTDLGPTWGDVRDLGLATYLETTSPARSPALVQRLQTNLIARATAAANTANAHAYGRGLGGTTWFWGVNGSVAAQTFLLHAADRIAPDARYRQAAETTVGYLFGRNYHNRSYVTGLGQQPPEHPHDRRGEPAWPGYLVGGGWPTGRSWRDLLADYEQNEIAINWNASLVYALAALAPLEADGPIVTTQPSSQAIATGDTVTLRAAATGAGTGPLAFQWYANGVALAGATSATLTIPGFASANAGIYDVVVSEGGSLRLSRPAVVGVVPAAASRTAGAVETRPEWQDIRHPSGNIYDQFLLNGASGTFTADPGEVARISFLDPRGSIVQVEMSGRGAVTVILESAAGPTAPALYNQSGISYMQGKPTVILAGADATTHLGIYSVGPATNPGVTRSDVVYPGWADVAVVGIASRDGALGGSRQGNVDFNATRGYSGVVAPSVGTVVAPPIVVHDIAASGDALPALRFAPVGQVQIRIAGGDLLQTNGQDIAVAGVAQVLMAAGGASTGAVAPAQTIRARLIADDGRDLTATVVSGP